MDLQKFGELLNDARQRGKLTQQALADQMSAKTGLYFSQPRIANWCQGKNLPNDRETLLTLCEALYAADGLTSLEEVNQILFFAGTGALYQSEIKKQFPDLIKSDTAKALGKNANAQPDHREISKKLAQRLPSATYTKLFGVESQTEQVLAALAEPQKHQIVSIQGIGGIGKTALADHVARAVMRQSDAFSDVLWVSAKQEYLTDSGILSTGTQMNLELLFDDLGRQLEQAEIARLPLKQKIEKLNRALSQEDYLVVIDNLETVRDFQKLVPILNKLTNPTKFMLTSREHLPSLTRVKLVSLQELDEISSLALIQHTAETKEVDGFNTRDVYDLVGGNPLAIILVVSLMRNLPHEEVLRGVEIGDTDDIYRYVYWKSWTALTDYAREIILVIQRAGDQADWEWLEIVTDFDPKILREAIQQLINLSLVQPQRGKGSELHYMIHRLTSTFLRTDILKWK